MRLYLFATVVAAACIGCGAGNETEIVTHIRPVCLFGPESVLEGSVRVEFAGCLSSSCDRLIGARCSVTSDGSEATITGRAEIERDRSGPCTADCQTVGSICSGSIGDAELIHVGKVLYQRNQLTACGPPS